MISQTHRLDVVPGGITTVVHVKQYQTDESLVFELFSRFGEFEISSEYTECTVRGTKSDGNGYSANADCDPSDNSVTVQLTEQMTAVAGLQPYEITVTDSSGRMITTTFFLNVHRAALDADTVVSESVIKEVQTIVEDYIEDNPGLFVVDPTLTQSGEAADAKVTGDEIADLKNTLDEYEDIFTGDVDTSVQNWLDVHPEATTSVEDHSLTYEKLVNGTLGFVTPEMYGAKGDGVTDDTTAIETCLNSGAKHFVFANTYKISAAISNVPNGTIIDGGGIIISSDAGFLLDKARNIIIRNLKIQFVTYGLHITSTAGYSDYCDFANLELTGTDSTSSVGVYIERTTAFNNEHRFTNITCWTVNKGFVMYNPDTTKECSGHRFLFCSAEQATTYGWELTNSDSLSLIYCRTEESNGRIIKTTGTCNRLTIIGTKLVFQQEQPFSDSTNGVALGCFRSGKIYDNTFGGYAKIVKGKIIPCNDLLTAAAASESINSDRSVPVPSGTTLMLENSWHKYGASASTLTLDNKYYGGYGLINEFYIYMGNGAGKITIVNGTFSHELASPSANTLYRFKYHIVNNYKCWTKETLTMEWFS